MHSEVIVAGVEPTVHSRTLVIGCHTDVIGSLMISSVEMARCTFDFA